MLRTSFTPAIVASLKVIPASAGEPYVNVSLCRPPRPGKGISKLIATLAVSLTQATPVKTDEMGLPALP